MPVSNMPASIALTYKEYEEERHACSSSSENSHIAGQSGCSSQITTKSTKYTGLQFPIRFKLLEGKKILSRPIYINLYFIIHFNYYGY